MMGNQQKTLNDFWRYWLFGLIDGDGCFALVKKTGKRNYYAYLPTFSISNTNLEIVNAVKLVVKKLGLSYHVQTFSEPGHKVRFVIGMHGIKRVKRFCDSINLYDGVKCDEFNLIKRFVDLRLSKEHTAITGPDEISCVKRLQKLKNARPGKTLCLSGKSALYWLGGIWDAEGAIGVHISGRYRGTIYYRPVIQLSHTDPSVIESIKRLFNVFGIQFRCYQFKPKKGYKVADKIMVRSDKCKEFLCEVGPYIVGKYLQVGLLKEFLNLANKTSKSKDAKHIYEKLHILNFRGIPNEHTPSILKE